MKKKNNPPINNGENIFSFLKKSYDEALNLITFSRDYFIARGKIDKANLSAEDSIAYTLAMSTITTQLTSVIGWLLMCRAVQNGEVSVEQLQTDEFKMPEFDLNLDDESSCFANLPTPIRNILVKSSRLYNRIKRIENSMEPVKKN